MLTTLLLLLLALTGCNGASTTAQTISLSIGGERFTLELALDDDARYQGLSDRKHIAPDGGMLFVFPRPREVQFVMRRCYVPIDIIYLGANGRIVSMHQMKVEPYDTPDSELTMYDSGWPAQFAIELAGGTLDRLKLEPGQRIDLPTESLAARAR